MIVWRAIVIGLPMRDELARAWLRDLYGVHSLTEVPGPFAFSMPQ